MNAQELLDQLEQWVFLNHDHHHGCDSEDCWCPEWDFPYVNSIELAAEIGRLRGRLE